MTEAALRARLDELEKDCRDAFQKLPDLAHIRTALLQGFDHPVWEEITPTCIRCTGCTAVCPTCTCFQFNEERLDAQSGVANADAVFTNGKLKVDYAAGCAFLDGKELHLTPSEYKLLCLLCRNVGKVLTHTFITQQIWGRSWENDIASLRVFMATLRKKLEQEPGSPQYIQTHIGVGYRMMRVE